MKTHELKIWNEHFEDIWNGVKKFELRKDDRGFQVGDELCLKEFNPETQKYTGSVQHKTVSHILKGGQFGLKKGYVIMSLE
ncbi:MAG: hypothetical protein BGO88_04775 [Flavobacterium sp. 38-13]|uniref:ASCH/PUA domain-containing protein n=1 Tax=Flavobacterium sp. 38-13 TaxID=1896168 RepID=UPI00095F9DB0|nr:ASCH/PUA domain-containing protein [Flavobacterium sp. 38-13]OJX55531.1 MAG: hypothetical protein BGO88_04775 [Flavobacterium sp. 38-13]